MKLLGVELRCGVRSMSCLSGLVVGIVLFHTFSALYFSLYMEGWLYSFPGMLHFPFVFVGVYQLFKFYFLALSTEPGSVPPNWVPPYATPQELEEAKNAALKSIRMPTTTRVRYCLKCNAFKPPRAHHCSVCRRCVLKMDHHCPWINNCVGHRNHKAFILFLLFASVMLGYAVVMLGRRAVFAFQGMSGGPPEVMQREGFVFVITLVNCVIGLPLDLGIVSLAVYQIGAVLSATTTLEEFDRYREEKAAKLQKQKYRWPYDKGRQRNFEEIMGRRVSDWFEMTQPRGDGLYTSAVSDWPEDLAEVV